MASKALSLTLYNLALPLGLVLMLPGAIRKMRRFAITKELKSYLN